ncbi:peptidoglycan bridge formation glycyltransferase FemA/FemB family protein [Candidatus Roizmanbacteria bacterium]|nr:peptidoglycan bridge formation glycyltransferase FemA/FemB family protein [Candidatus Roizmanbacteria bacterium]
MNIQQIDNKINWNEILIKASFPSFLQSWEWGEVQKKAGYSVERITIGQGNDVAAMVQIIKVRAKYGSFLFVPHGPIILRNPKTAIKKLLDYLIKVARKENYSFLRIAPLLEDTSENRKTFQDLGFKTGPTYMSAESVWVLPLNKSEDELLLDMRKTTRYLIRKAIREGVVIEKRADSKAVDDFYKLYEETVKREKFVPFSKKFIRDEFEAFHKTGNAVFLFGKHEKSYLSSALILFTKSSGFYHQGASIHSKIPVPYLLQWEAIKEAKRRGSAFYNFWGVYRPGRTPKNWQGLTLFKTGFGGKQIDYILPQDYIISPKYYVSYLYEKFLAWKREV